METVRRGRDKIQNFDMLPENARDHVFEVLQKMEAISNLYSVRSKLPCCFGVLAAMIPAHYLHTRVLLKPPGEGVCATVRQDLYQSAVFKVHQDRPVVGSPTEGQVVHAQDPGCFVILELQRADMF